MDDDRRSSVDVNPKGAERPTPTIWVIGEGSGDCPHQPDGLERLGGDGVNGYYRCPACAAVLVIAGEVGYLARKATDAPDGTG
ncbi:MAG: hypothetical protein R3324_22065 [Halobacteriales archaeon]|nr:hypothetical protein [Halobacteriales archaeon]